MTFGEKLQSLRQRAGMSQDALAERLQVSRQAVSRWERDETMPETDKVVALADIFGVTTDYLLRPRNGRTGWSVFWPLASGSGTCWDGC